MRPGEGSRFLSRLVVAAAALAASATPFARGELEVLALEADVAPVHDPAVPDARPGGRLAAGGNAPRVIGDPAVGCRPISPAECPRPARTGSQ